MDSMLSSWDEYKGREEHGPRDEICNENGVSTASVRTTIIILFDSEMRKGLCFPKVISEPEI